MTDDASLPKALLDTHPHLADFNKFLGEMNKETERGTALIACVMLDNLLEKTIRSFLVQDSDIDLLLRGFNAPLGTFSSRIQACYSMGLISTQEYGECLILKKVRNVFAHGVHVSFKDQNIVDLCKRLTLGIMDIKGWDTGARRQFTTAAIVIILDLTNRPHYVSQARLNVVNWKR
jgi:mannitol operon repressor